MNILNIIEDILNKIQTNIDTLEEKLIKPYLEEEDSINVVIKNPDMIKDFDLEKLKKHIEIDDSLFKELVLYKKLASRKNKLLNLLEDQKILLKQKFIDFRNIIVLERKDILNNNQEYNNLKTTYAKLLGIFKKIKKGIYIDNDELKFLFELDNIRNDLNNMKELILFNNKLYEDSINFEEEVVDFSNLDINEVKDLFRKFNLNFNDLNNNSQQKILLYGNILNIKSILKVLSDSSIKINLKEYGDKFVEILLLSNSSNVLTIIQNIKKDLNSEDLIELNKMFTNYLSIPAVFIKGLKTFEKTNTRKGRNKPVERKPKTDSRDKLKEENRHYIVGGFNNYLLNRELFIQEGIDINKAIEICPSIFSEPHRNVKLNLLKFKMYKVNMKTLHNTLSAFRASYPLDIIDMYIEGGFESYILDNLSIIINMGAVDYLYQMLNAKRSGYTDDQIFVYRKLGEEGQVKKTRRASNLLAFAKDHLSNEDEYKQSENPKLELLFQEFSPINEKIFKTDYIKILDNNFLLNDRTYDINGIYISRYKVLRLYSILLENGINDLETFKYIIFRKKIINVLEYKTLSSILDKVLGRNQDNQANSKEFENLNDPNFYIDKFIKMLDDYFTDKNNPLLYKFNTVYVERNKVIQRIYLFFGNPINIQENYFKLLSGAITYGLDNKEIEIVNQALEEKIKNIDIMMGGTR